MRVFAVLPLVSLPLLSVLVAGCATQHDCAQACTKLFGEQDGQCNIVVPGHSDDQGRQDMIDMCETHCEAAMAQAGEVGNYNPNERTSGNEDVGLANDAQAALWMQCIDETSCSDLNDNYCAPTTNFPAN